VASDVCAALDFSHRNGIVHRDIKPANVMITPAGAVKVMDFGIARAVADNAATVTQTANVIGTAQYLSPEQARGETVDARSDVYSTGCLLYELVTGAPPFQGDSPVAVAYQHVRENAAPPSSRNAEIPPALDSIVMKALAKNQLNRYQSAGDMRTDLQRALANQPVAAEAVMTDAERTQFIARTPAPPSGYAAGPGPAPDEPDDSRRTGLIWAAVVVALLLVIGAAAYAVVFIGRTDKVSTVNVPSLYGKTPQAASTQLQGLGFTPVVGPATNGPCDGNLPGLKGQVCTQDPPSVDGTTKAKKGATVTFNLYTEKLIQVPAVVGLPFATASNQIVALGLPQPTSTQADSNVPAGQVLSQSVLPYTRVPAGTKIVLTVSSGKVKLPDVRNKKQADAVLALNQAGWPNITVSPTPILTTDPAKNGLVATENPNPGIAYAQTQTITLGVYQYQQACTTPPPAPSTSSSVSGSTSGSASSSPPASSSAPATSSSSGPPACPSGGSSS
jgi:beta-lactam-binding protein with PASTA domain